VTSGLSGDNYIHVYTSLDFLLEAPLGCSVITSKCDFLLFSNAVWLLATYWFRSQLHCIWLDSVPLNDRQLLHLLRHGLRRDPGQKRKNIHPCGSWIRVGPIVMCMPRYSAKRTMNYS